MLASRPVVSSAMEMKSWSLSVSSSVTMTPTAPASWAHDSCDSLYDSLVTAYLGPHHLADEAALTALHQGDVPPHQLGVEDVAAAAAGLGGRI